MATSISSIRWCLYYSITYPAKKDDRKKIVYVDMLLKLSIPIKNYVRWILHQNYKYEIKYIM